MLLGAGEAIFERLQLRDLVEKIGQIRIVNTDDLGLIPQIGKCRRSWRAQKREHSDRAELRSTQQGLDMLADLLVSPRRRLRCERASWRGWGSAPPIGASRRNTVSANRLRPLR